MLRPGPHGGPNPRVGGVQVWHWWDSGGGAAALSPTGDPAPAQRDGVLCHQGTLRGEDRMGSLVQALGAGPLPASPWGLVPLWGRTSRSPWV